MHTDNCDEISNYIFFPDDLNIQEMEKLKKHLHSCLECNSLFNKINKIKLLNAGHISSELLSRYLLFEIGSNKIEDKIATHDIIELTGHIKSCKECQTRYYELKSIYLDINNYLEESGLPEIEIRPFIATRIKLKHTLLSKLFGLIQNLRFNKRLIYGSLMTSVIIFLIVLFYDFKEPINEDIAYFNNIEIPISTRGGTSNNLQDAIFLFNEKKYSKSINQLEDIIFNDNDITYQNYARYILGLCYLKLATRNDNLNESLIDIAIIKLDSALSDSINIGLKENIFWFIGKAYLLKRDIPQAIVYFDKVYRIGGNRLNESDTILKQLKEIE